MKWAVFLILCLSIQSVSIAQFAPESSYITSNFYGQTISVEVGDMDGDGLDDFLIQFEFYNKTGWAKNLGDGNWSTLQFISQGEGSGIAIKAADMDGDGDMDALTAFSNNSNYTMIGWIENLGSGKFGSPQLIFSKNTSFYDDTCIDAGDLDGDGDVDIVATLGNDSNVYWFRNEDGLGSFSEIMVVCENSSDVEKIRVADIDGDPFPDLVYVMAGNIIRGTSNFNGLGFFGTPYNLATPASVVNHFEFADLDGDGDKDLVAAVGGGNVGTIQWYKNLDGNGLYAQGIQIAGSLDYPGHIKTGDFDGDGNIDILCYEFFDGRAVWLRNQGGAAFGTKQTIFLHPNLFTYSGAIGAMDLDGDSDLDVFLTQYSGFHLVFATNNDGAGSFSDFHLPFFSPYTFQSVAIDDVNQDGYADIILTGDPFGSFVQPGDGPAVSWSEYREDLGYFQSPKSIDNIYIGRFLTTRDLNSDSINDLIFAAEDSSKIIWYINDGEGNYDGPYSVNSATSYPRQMKFGDIDGDGFEDLVISGWESPGYFTWYKKNGAEASFGPPETILAGSSIWDFKLADFNGDSLTDIVIANRDNNSIGCYLNTGGAFGPYIPLAGLQKPVGIQVHDFNQDGYPDILAQRNLNDNIYLIESLGQLSYKPPAGMPSLGSEPSSLSVFDYDGDGDQDVLYMTSNEPYPLRWMENTQTPGNMFEYAKVIPTATTGPGFLQFFDMDSDQDIDMVYSGNSQIFWKKNLFSNSRLTARAFYDLNTNGETDTGEPMLKNIPFQLSPDPTLYFSKNDGTVQFFLQEGEYLLSSSPPAPWMQTTSPLIDTIIIVDDETMLEKNISFHPWLMESNLHLGLTSASTRCAWQVPFWLSLANLGTTIDSGYVELELSDLATFISADPMPDSVSNEFLRWTFSALSPTFFQSIRIDFQVADVSFLGDSILMTSRAFRQTSGGYYTLADTHLFASEIRCAYDPNDKLAHPEGVYEEHFVNYGHPLEYTVRFQNTGTDTAFIVKIIDQLDPHLDWSSLRILGASHPHEVSISETGEVTFLFDQILLPDSTTNEPASHGFIKFEIFPAWGLPENTVVENTAAIYFDFNPPIITNTLTHTLVREIPLYLDIFPPLCHESLDGAIHILQADALGGFVFQWQGPYAGTSAEDLGDGTYFLEVKDQSGNIVSDTLINLIAPPPLLLTVFSIPATIGLADGSALAAVSGGTPPYMFSWDTNPAQETAEATGLAPGVYHVTVTDANGCEAYEDIAVLQLVSDGEIKQGDPSFTVRPNPGDGEMTVTIQLPGYGAWTLELSDNLGRKIAAYGPTDEDQGLSITRKLHIQQPGLYWLTLSWMGKVTTQKVVSIN